ncbi:MAG TPA: carboxylating nicotinate-nucleotide diphosphorylase [Burkholderiales bacterium]|nr:carboxylating nicotinate-nucleotide diphosphorylase [Burkholderiales bacterium]
MSLPEPLPAIMVEPLVRAALLEDLGRGGDITTAATIPASLLLDGVVASRQSGVLAGTDAAALAFRLLDPGISVVVERPDGSRVSPGDIVFRLKGPARAVLSAERVALNLLCHLCGVATATAALVEAVRPFPARIVCTRKTTPGLRMLEKHAVRAGGGSNHRFGLDDAILIKDNHVALAGGIRDAIVRCRQAAGPFVKIEVEVDTIPQLAEALQTGVDAVLLDNMTPEQMREAVRMVDGRALVEASGRIRLENVNAVAATGVDLISAGWITHSAPALDLGLDVKSSGESS